MKVKARLIGPPYKKAATESLQAVVRNHAHDKLFVRISIRQLFDILEELTIRRKAMTE